VSITEQIAAKVKSLPPEKQQEVLDFVEFLRERSGPSKPLLSPEGLWKDLKIEITEADIDEARREMWGNFPREFDR
jgi:hypothetical protein